MDFEQIPAGEFLMGASPEERMALDDERPRHRVRITRAFQLGRCLVTQEEWEAVMGTNPSDFRGARRPVECVSWHDAQEFLRRLNARQDGFVYRLPTEAEWEYAARAGSDAPYPGELDAIAWTERNSGNQTHPVAEKAPNRWGLFDIIGNVSEWCADWFAADYYQVSPGNDPTGPAAGFKRLRRGASFGSADEDCRVACRYMGVPGLRAVAIGFRCLRQPGTHTPLV